MSFTWEFESDDMLVIRITAQVTYHQIIDFLDEIKVELKDHSEIYEFIFCAEDLVVDLPSDSAMLVADKLKNNLSVRDSGALAFICSTDHIYGLCRQLGMRVENDNMSVDVFRTEVEARDWIQNIRSLDIA